MSPHPPATRLSVSFEGTPAQPALGAWLRRQLRVILPLAGVQGGSIDLLIVGDSSMRRLHRRHMGLNSTTDVLTFDLRDHLTGPPAADIVLCRDEAQRQAARRGHEVRCELLLYAVHGLLHTLGYDDHVPAEADRMHALEDELLIAAGIGPVYATTGRRITAPAAPPARPLRRRARP